MKILKFSSVLLLIFCLSTFIFSCSHSCKNHADTTGDGICDNCGEPIDDIDDDGNFITYEDYGAVGDGVANDFTAIYLAHTAANRSGLPLKIKQDATYRISDTGGQIIPIETDVFWGTAKFIIDDKDLTPEDENKDFDQHIFVVNPETTSKKIPKTVIERINSGIADGSITVGKDTTKLDVGLGYPALLLVTNSKHKNYIRYGRNADDGSSQAELILIDENGNIDPSTPFLHDYDTITSITVLSINDTPITIEGGIFTTIAPDYNTKGATKDYFDRGIEIKRSNVTLKNVVHYVDNQKAYDSKINPGWVPVSYHGFFVVSYCNNVKLDGCVMTGRAGSGTYDFSLSYCNNLTAYNCTMTNFFVDGVPSVSKGYWGVMGSNRCKNLTYDSCELTRFDAHAGLYNGKIINSKISLISIIGGGEMLIQNTEIFYDRLIELRTDYGATWNGVVKIYDCKFSIVGNETPSIFVSTWANHDFGYTTCFPNLEIKNLQITSGNSDTKIHIIRPKDITNSQEQNIGVSNDIHKDILDDGTENKNPMVPPEYFLIIENNYNVNFEFPDSEFFVNTRT